ncbi:MAG: hypothetical protein U5L00_21180 [Desulfovermiculus sp.]|nr:hypothetical protein [Desulfovermiculus sp.]
MRSALFHYAPSHPDMGRLFGVLFFILSKPFAAASEILMLRHYIEGAVSSCLAALLFLSALKNDSMPRAGWAAFFYLSLAMLCKEVYIPLPLLLCFAPQGHFRQRIKMALCSVPACLSIWDGACGCWGP